MVILIMMIIVIGKMITKEIYGEMKKSLIASM